MVKKRQLLLLVAIVSSLAFSSAGAATTKAPATPAVRAVKLADSTTVKYIPSATHAATAPKAFETTDQFGNRISCVGMKGSEGFTTLCSVPTATSKPTSYGSENHLPNPPLGFCFSENIVDGRRQGQPLRWIYVCVCTPDGHFGEPPRVFLFEDAEGKPAFGDPTANPSTPICVGARDGINGIYWVCVMRVWR